MNEKHSFRWAVLFLCVFGAAVLNFSGLIFASRPTDVMAQFNMTQAQLTAISTISQLPGAIFSIVLGNLLDRKGIRKIGSIMFALAALCMIWRVFADSYVELMLITFLGGLFFLPIYIVSPKLIGIWFPRDEMATAMGVFGAAAGIGTSLAFALGNKFPTTQNAFAWIAGGYILMVLLWVALAKDAPITASEKNTTQLQAPKSGFAKVAKSKNMWLIMICGGLAVGAPLLLNTYLVNAFIEKGLNPSQAGNIATILNISLMTGGILSGIVVSKVGLYNLPYMVICFAGALFYYISYMIPLGSLTYILIAAGGLISSGAIGVNMARIPLISMTGDFGPEFTGTAAGMNNTSVGICAFAVPTIVAIIAGDNYTLIFTIVAAFLIIIGLIGGLLIPELGEKGKLAKSLRSKA